MKNKVTKKPPSKKIHLPDPRKAKKKTSPPKERDWINDGERERQEDWQE